MENSQILNWILQLNFLQIFFKIIALVFSFLYFGFAIIIFYQTRILSKTLQTEAAYILVFISFLQILLALFIILLAIFLI